MDIVIKIKRFNPANNKVPFYQDFILNLDINDIILDILLKIRSELDPSLGLRCSCQSAICGSCAMVVNGKSMLVCNKRVADVLEDGVKEIVIEPPANQKVVKDLIVDLDLFWDKIKSIDPWLKTDKEPEREFVCNSDDMYDLSKVTGCIMCGACVSSCTVLNVDKSFIGPAALAKVYRFVGDPRDSKYEDRLESISKESGIWDCTHCFMCVEACPKEVSPMDRILSLRKKAMDLGINDNIGARHAKAIINSVKHSGTLNEVTVMPNSYGWFNIPKLMTLIPVGIRMLLKNKMPSIIHKKLLGTKYIKNIYNKVIK